MTENPIFVLRTREFYRAGHRIMPTHESHRLSLFKVNSVPEQVRIGNSIGDSRPDFVLNFLGISENQGILSFLENFDVLYHHRGDRFAEIVYGDSPLDLMLISAGYEAVLTPSRGVLTSPGTLMEALNLKDKGHVLRYSTRPGRYLDMEIVRVG